MRSRRLPSLRPSPIGLGGISICDARVVLERRLEGIQRFWDERVIDRHHGGYRLGHDLLGRPTGNRAKHLVTQARVVWYFARMARSPYGDERHLRWAAHGMRYLRDHMWDRRYGGFQWQLDPDGARDARKHVYGQAFAVLALAEFARSASDWEAAALARDVVELIEAHAHDPLFGGYRESHRHDWSPEPRGRWSVLGHPTHVKTTNTHLHLLEALTELARVRPDAVLRARLRELIAIMTGPAIDFDHGTCWHACGIDWTPHGAQPSSYGHDLENVSLLLRACRVAGVDERAVAETAAKLWANALAHGFDHRHGGFFEGGERGRAAGRRRKVGWVQAEALVSALAMWRRTGITVYRHAFERTLAWIDREQADDVCGDWHPAITSTGRRTGEKSGAWNDPYHQGRAMLECLELLAS